MAINTHGYKMKGIKAAAGLTKHLTGYYGKLRVQINYDLDNGTVWGCEHVGTSRTIYNSPNIITVIRAHEPLTMQAIADTIANAADDYNAYLAYVAEVKDLYEKAPSVWEW